MLWVLLGAGGHAAGVAAVILGRGDTVGGCAGEGPTPARLGVRHFDNDTSALRWASENGAAVALAVGDNRTRHRLYGGLSVTAPSLVARTAVVAAGADLADGVVVAELAAVGPGAVVGAAAVVNTAAVVEHDATVGAGSHVAPRAVLLGAAKVGVECLVGAGAVVLPGRCVGDGATVGAGAIVDSDVRGGVTVKGVPAR